ncbi:peptidylprolyl isomerase [Olea europaea subsp. europaea]|uniref:Peptidylprolyl isomerase n=1 Tax=Olea europaea subsp. europaea TaxID=158383 RepID=A0A8S0R4Y5_OLEEU|nr:peptidylprolyl isomerase [Olea europaea subsp. europaea]
MARKQSEYEPNHWVCVILLLMCLVSCSVVYMFMSAIFRSTSAKNDSNSSENVGKLEVGESVVTNGGGCCTGIENLELWGDAVKWGSDFKFNSSEECCKACKSMCTGIDGPCLCDTWVFCGNKHACWEKFGECWLKKQKDTLAPVSHEAGSKFMWTTGLIFGRGEGIVGLQTEYGTLHIKLLPECSPQSVAYILELLALRHCAGCHFFRAESRGQSWDTKGNHVKDASFGPPFALIQGTLGVEGMTFNKLPSEYCPTMRKGSVAWVGSGPEFFISLANHQEWRNLHTVFGSVLPEDMVIADKIAQLPTKSDVWKSINVSVLEKKVPFRFQRFQISHDELNFGAY